MTGRPADPGLEADLATLREMGMTFGEALALERVEAELSRLREVEESFKHLSSEYQFDMDRGDHLVYREEWERFDRWQRLRDTLEEVDFVGAEGFAADMVAAARAEASRLREQRARCARLQQALAKADKAASKAHDAMWAMDFDKTSASSSERDAWKRLREQASDAIWAIHNLLRPLMAREALAGLDTLTAGDQGVAPDGTGRVAPADGCAERQSTADPSPAASAGPDTPADPDAPFDYLDCTCDGEEGCAYCGDTPAESQPEEPTT